MGTAAGGEHRQTAPAVNTVETSRWDVSISVGRLGPCGTSQLKSCKQIQCQRVSKKENKELSDFHQRYQGKYRIDTSRLKGWDYTTTGYYFVTICTQNRIHWFGEIVKGCIILSPVGEITKQELENTTSVHPNTNIDLYTVMPNHIHAIVVIGEASVETSRRDVSTKTRYLQSGSLGAIVNQNKSQCTKRIRQAGYPNFTWQARYYDHIIQNE